jgi:hypothetical protein
MTPSQAPHYEQPVLVNQAFLKQSHDSVRLSHPFDADAYLGVRRIDHLALEEDGKIVVGPDDSNKRSTPSGCRTKAGTTSEADRQSANHKVVDPAFRQSLTCRSRMCSSRFDPAPVTALSPHEGRGL